MLVLGPDSRIEAKFEIGVGKDAPVEDRVVSAGVRMGFVGTEAPSTAVGVVQDLGVAGQRQADALGRARSPGDLEPWKIGAVDFRHVRHVQWPADVSARLRIIVLERAVEPESMLDDRSAYRGRGGVGIRRLDRRIAENPGALVDCVAQRLSVVVGEGRILTVNRYIAMPVIRALAGDRVDDAAEDVVLGVKTTRDHLDRIDAFESKLLLSLPGDWIGHVQPIDQIAVVITAPAQDEVVDSPRISADPRGQSRDIRVRPGGWNILKLIDRNYHPSLC